MGAEPMEQWMDVEFVDMYVHKLKSESKLNVTRTVSEESRITLKS